MKGHIAQIETMGVFDGPGLRTVIFFQGCPLRCEFCHNPEMWDVNGGKEYSAREIVDIILKYKNYFGEDGGVTFSGGEPLAQPEFLLECLKLCKENNIHTVVDTSGNGNENYNKEILKYTDLIMFSIKEFNDGDYYKLTGTNISKSLEFLKLASLLNKEIWIRNVILPGINDNDEHLNKLVDFIKKINNVTRVDLLPYHTLALSKYEKLNIDYKLKKVKAMNTIDCQKLEDKLIELLH